MKIRLFLPGCLLLSAFVFAGEAEKSGERLLLDFETGDPAANGRSCELSVVSTGVTQGAKALQLRFDPSVPYPAVDFAQTPPADFRAYGGLAFDVMNPGTETVGFGVRIDSSLDADGSGMHSRSGKGTIDGGQKAGFVLPFGVDPTALKMAGIPGFGGLRNLGFIGSGPFDLGHIVSWQIFQNRPYSPQTIIVDNFRLVPARPLDFGKIVDPYGQYSREDWPGKIKEPGDFAAQLTSESAEISAHATVPGRDKFGGWESGPRLEATGFFRVAKHDGKWTFVDPEGRLFLSIGPTTVTSSAMTPLEGREYMFSSLPENDPTLVPFTSDKGLDFLSANLLKKYGENYKQAWYEQTYARLASWGFNTIGAFSSWDTLSNGKIPYTSTIWVGGKHARLKTGKEQVRSMSDPFDPQFASDVAMAFGPQARRIKDDPYCIGYFVGNEEDWGHFRSGPAHHYALVLSALKAPSESSPAKRSFLAALRQKYGDIAKLNSAWGTAYPQWSALDEPMVFKAPFKPAMLEDFSMLLASLAEQYFRIVAQELKKADPNHLYLGCRFAGYSPEVLEAAAKYCDVLSFNVYRLALDSKEWGVLDSVDKPFVIGEFHFGATDRGAFDGGLIPVADQKARGSSYQTYLRSVLAHPACIGAHWFQYTDQPTTGRPGDGENGNVGFVSITDTPYPELIEAAREINAKIYSIRFGP